MTEPTEQSPAGPYAVAAQLYRRAGWVGVLPLPPGTKWPPPEGWTGNDGPMPSPSDVGAWLAGEPISYRGRDGQRHTYSSDSGNIALRLPHHVVGIDVDHYASGGVPKGGGDTLAALEAAHGRLPPTWRVTARDDGVSGIRLYRVPPGLAWPNGLGPGIEIVRHAHRYAVAWPSIHPDTGGTYRWINGDGLTVLGDVPNVDALPDLPAEWVQHITGGREAGDVRRGINGVLLDDDAAVQWLNNTGPGQPCRAMLAALARAAGDLRDKAASRHDVALAATARVAHLAAEGHPGVAAIMNGLYAAFTSATAGERRDPSEWHRMVAGAVNVAAAAPPLPPGTPDPCSNPFAGLIAGPMPTLTPSAGPTRGTESWPSPLLPSAATSAAGPVGAPASAPAPGAEPVTGPAYGAAGTASFSGPPDPQGSADGEPEPVGPDGLTDRQRNLYRAQAVASELERERARRTARDLLDAERAREVADGGPAYLRALDEEVARHRVRDGARRIIAADGQARRPAPRALDAFLLEPDPPVTYRIDGLWPAGGRVMLTAAFKAGKSTLVGNVVRCLVDGGDLLGKWPVTQLGTPDGDRPDGRVVLFDDELDENTLRRWLRDQRIVHAERVSVVSLRGAVSSFDILDPHVRTAWADVIRGLSGAVVILDCLRPVLDAVGLDEHSDAGRFLTAFDDLLGEAGAQEAIIVHHAGHEGERARGDSRLRDWPDVEWRLVREKTESGGDAIDPSARRYFAAYGRDVDVPEGALAFDAVTRRLTFEGGNRSEAKASGVVPFVIEALRENPAGLSERGVIDYVANLGAASRRDVQKGLAEAFRRRLIVISDGPRGAKWHTLAHAVPVVQAPDNGSSTFANGSSSFAKGSSTQGSPTAAEVLTAPVRHTAPPLHRRSADDCASAPIGAHGAVVTGRADADRPTSKINNAERVDKRTGELTNDSDSASETEAGTNGADR